MPFGPVRVAAALLLATAAVSACSSAPATCMQVPKVYYTLGSAPERSLPPVTAGSVKAPVENGEQVTLRFDGPCLAGARVQVTSDGSALSGLNGYGSTSTIDLDPGRSSITWTANTTGTTLLAAHWSCSGPVPCPDLTLGSIVATAPVAPLGANASAAAVQVRNFIALGGRWCTAADLRGRLGTGEEAAGTLWTPVYVANISSTTCALPGPVSMVGLTRTLARDTPVSSCHSIWMGSQAPCPAPAILVPNGNAADPANPPLVILTGAAYRDDPESLNGLCTPEHTTTPYWLRLTIGHVVVLVRNWNPASGSAPRGVHAVFGCHGAIWL